MTHLGIFTRLATCQNRRILQNVVGYKTIIQNTQIAGMSAIWNVRNLLRKGRVHLSINGPDTNSPKIQRNLFNCQFMATNWATNPQDSSFCIFNYPLLGGHRIVLAFCAQHINEPFPSSSTSVDAGDGGHTEGFCPFLRIPLSTFGIGIGFFTAIGCCGSLAEHPMASKQRKSGDWGRRVKQNADWNALDINTQVIHRWCVYGVYGIRRMWSCVHIDGWVYVWMMYLNTYLHIMYIL